MKINRQKLLMICIILLLISAVIFYVYDVVSTKTLVTRNLFRVGVGVCMLVGALVKLNPKAKRKSLEFYEKTYINELGDAFKLRPDLRKKLLGACRLFNENKAEKALKILNQLREKAQDKNDMVPVLLFTALCYEEQEYSGDAYKAYEEILTIDPDNVVAMNNLGLITKHEGDDETAMELFSKAIEIAPDYYAYSNRANIYFNQREFDDAIADAKRAIECKNNGKEAATLLAIIYALQGDDENREKYFHLAVSQGADPKDLNLAIAHYSATKEISSEE